MSGDPSPCTTATYDANGNVLTQTDASGNTTAFAYDRLGRVTSTTDQNNTTLDASRQRGVTHTYTYGADGTSAAGKVTLDAVTIPPGSTGVDDTVLSIVTAYDDVGRVQTVSSSSDTAGTEILNQVKYVYNGWGQGYQEYQEHAGDVGGGTPYVEYDYLDGATGTKAAYVRLDHVVYPTTTRQIGYNYAAGVDEIMSRLSSISDGASDTYASYKYLGLGRIVVEDYEDIDVKLDYAADNFAALDRFGRVADQIWTDYGEDPDVVLDHYSYEYDRAGNRTSKDNELHSAFDEDYLYDALDRLTDSDRADNFDQSWGLDGLGNFSAFNDDGTSQTRTVNEANQIQTISGSAGWKTPKYDAAGNMIFAPKSGDETTGLHFVRDAWNRQVAVYEDDGDGVYEPGTDNLLAKYEFDGANRRIEKTFPDESGVEYYYNHQWQLLEERSVDDQGATTAANQYVYSARYIDAPAVRFHDGNGDGDLLDAGDNTHYYTGDANFNVTATIDAATGDVVNRYAYSAYGEVTVYDDAWSNPAPANEDGPLYAGYFFDAETGNSRVRFREYITSASTFDATDPIAADINLYRYVHNTPINLVDPSGLQRGPDTMARDAATPRRVAKKFEYVPGAVEFYPLPLGRPIQGHDEPPEGQGGLYSDFSFTWRVNPMAFWTTIGGKKCQTCTKVGIMQIYKNSYRANAGYGVPFLSPFLTEMFKNDSGFNLDKKNPYPSGGIIDNPGLNFRQSEYDDGTIPTTIAGNTARYHDSPGSIINNIFVQTDQLTQSFELHFVCLAGAEKGATYGGIEWWHQFTINALPTKYELSGYDFKYSSDAIEIRGPSKTNGDWQRIWDANPPNI